MGERLEVGFAPHRHAELRVTLRFVEERFEQRGSGSNRSVQHVCYELFRQEQRLTSLPTSSEAPIAFELPDRPEWVTGLSEQPLRYWELVVDSEVPGVDFHAEFPLPVYSR